MLNSIFIKVLYAFAFLCVALTTQAQSKSASDSTQIAEKKADSIRQAAIEYASILDPRIRQFSISYTNQPYARISGKSKDGHALYSGKLNNSQVNMNLNIPIIQNTKNSLVLSVGSQQQFFNTKDMVGPSGQPLEYGIDDHMPMASLGLAYTRSVKLFGKEVYTVLAANGIFNPSMSSRQFTFTGIATMPLIRKQYTSFSVGAIATLNPVSPAPFFVFASYYHKFKNINTELMIGLPYIAIRKELSSKASLSLRGDLVGNNTLFKVKNRIPDFPEDLTYSSMDIRSGLLFEYRLTKKLIFSAGSGINTNLRNRILENNKKPSNYLIDNKYKSTPYFQVGISMLPFWKGLGL